VLIVGAGIAGLALGRKLLAAGVDCTIVDRRGSAALTGAGLLLTGNAVRVLEALGVGGPLHARGARVERVSFTDDRQRPLFEVDCAARPAWGAFLSIERAALQATLLEGDPQVQPRWGVTVAAVSERDDAVRATLSNGSAIDCDVLVGADGVGSDTRRAALGLPAVEPIADFHGWRFLAPCPAGLDAPQYMLGNGCTLLLHPLRNGKVYCGAGPVWLPNAAEDREPPSLRKVFGAFGGFAPEVLSHAGSAAPTRYWHVDLPTWTTRRCVLIGDAAHACAPTLAQGGAMALEDALVLGTALAAVEDEDVATTLALFEQRRRPRVVLAQQRSLQRMSANKPMSAREIALRNAILANIGATQFLDDWTPLMEGSP
jgi:FAD-dependent urate hydroxylase